MTTTWFSSDQHFGHANIIGFAERPFTDASHMDAELARRWRECVMPDDEIWLLGDVAMGKLDESLTLVDSLPGHKHLITGNHDRCFGGRGSAEKIERETKRYLEVFETVAPFGELEVAGRHVRLCHFPYTGESRPGHPDRYTGNRLDDDGSWLLCGHVHQAWQYQGWQINVGVDVWPDYYPVSEEEIGRLMDEIEAGD